MSKTNRKHKTTLDIKPDPMHCNMHLKPFCRSKRALIFPTHKEKKLQEPKYIYIIINNNIIIIIRFYKYWVICGGVYNLVISSRWSWVELCVISSLGAELEAMMLLLDALEEALDLTFVFGNLWSFFHFILLFWNQILICLSERHKEWAISMRLRLVRYLL